MDALAVVKEAQNELKMSTKIRITLERKKDTRAVYYRVTLTWPCDLFDWRRVRVQRVVVSRPRHPLS